MAMITGNVYKYPAVPEPRYAINQKVRLIKDIEKLRANGVLHGFDDEYFVTSRTWNGGGHEYLVCGSGNGWSVLGSQWYVPESLIEGLTNEHSCPKSPHGVHEYVNVGFSSITMVCKHCDKEERDEKDR